VEGHCLIVPNGHVAAFTIADEEVWDEAQELRRNLTRMFAENDEDCVFFECVKGLNRHPHTIVHCVPVSKEVGEMLPMYYKKAILESESEWSHNIKLVDFGKKGLRRSIPKGLPYFSVDFGVDSGFGHVIEDEREFDSYFGLEVVGGLMDVEPRKWLKQQHESFAEQSQKVLRFQKMWSATSKVAKSK